MTENSYGTDNESRITNHESRIKIGGQGCSALLSHYTLLEIMMVVAIMALLMAITMPAFNDMMKGQGVESAARNICQRLKLARSYAISNREYVAVLMPQSKKNTPNAYPSTGMPSSYYDRAYRACLVTKTGSATYDFKRWIPSENWTFLPTGTAIFETDADKGVAFDSNFIPQNDGSQCATVSNVDCSELDGGTVNVGDFKGVVFKPNGTVDASVYIVIGEGTSSGGTLVVTNRDAASVASIEINQFTGRVSYGED